MGCQSSQVQKSLQVRLCIIDSNFMRSNNQKIRQKMQRLGIIYQAYISLNCFVEDMSKVYSNDVVATQQQYSSLKKELAKLNYFPNIYLITGKQEEGRKQNDICFCKDYQDIIKILTDKLINKRKNSIKPMRLKRRNVTVKIFKCNSTKSTEEIIFQQTLKNKHINYQFYDKFNDLQKSMQQVTSQFIISDYVYHREVLNLVNTKDIKVICYCELNNEQFYDPRTYFVTNSFLEVATQLASQQSMQAMNSVKCSKVYIYAPQQSYITQYTETIQSFGFATKVCLDLQKIMKETKYFFCCTIIIDPQQRKRIQNFLQKNGYQYKVKLIQIMKGTQNSVRGLRKVLKQMKKGYKALKGKARSVDVIDKHFENVKFDEIKKQLDKNDIACYGFINLNNYIKHKKFVSPFIICNFQQRMLLIRYLNQINSKSKIILFCNKNNITPELKEQKQFAFVNSHFGKIMKFIKKTEVYNPYIIDQNQNKIKEKKQKLKNGNRRISALKWCGSNSFEKGDLNQLQKNFEFLNINRNINQSQIKEIQKQSSSLFKLDYKPTGKVNTFKKDFIQSLRKLKGILKISYPDNDFNIMVNQIQKMTSSQLLLKVKQFFKSQNQLGVKINKSLINVDSLTKEEIIHMRQFLYLVNINFLAPIKMQNIGKHKLHHFTNQALLQKCQVGSYILNKNYFICYQQSSSSLAFQNDGGSLSKIRIDFQIQYNSLGQNQLYINSFFSFKDKYIFSPFSQFLIKSINRQGQTIIIEVQYKKNIQFLRCFYADNLLDNSQSIAEKFQKEVQKCKNNSQESLLTDLTNFQLIQRNLIRAKALNLFKNKQISKAIELQRQLIISEEKLQNFDCITLNDLNYELAFFYYKQEKYSECKKFLSQLLQAEPGSYLKQRIKKLLSLYKETQLNSEQYTKNKEIIETFELNNIQNRQEDDSDKISESESQSYEREKVVFEFQFPCIQMDKADQYQQQEKENIA